MKELFLAHLNEFIVDSTFVVLVAAVYAVYRTRAALFVLVNFAFVLIAAYGLLLYVSYSHQYTVDYHLFMSVYQLAFFGLVMVTVKKSGLLKFAIALGALNSGVAMLNSPVYDLGWIEYETYERVYSSYPIARILAVTLQILGLVIYGDDTHRRYDDTNNRIRSSVRHLIDSFRVNAYRILRVEKT